MSDPLRPSGLKPTSLLCPWDSPGKNTGVGCISFSRGSSQPRDWTFRPGIELASLMSPVLAGGFFTTSATWEAPNPSQAVLKKTKGEVKGNKPDEHCLWGDLRSSCLDRTLWGASSTLSHPLSWRSTPVRPAPRVPVLLRLTGWASSGPSHLHSLTLFPCRPGNGSKRCPSHKWLKYLTKPILLLN